MARLRGQIASAAKWSAAATLARLLTSYGTLLLAAPFVSAEEFGLFALIVMILSFGQILSEAGLRDALIYRTEAARAEFSSVFWLCLASAVLVFLLLWAAAPVLAAIFEFSDLESWIRISAPVAAILAVGAPHQAILENDLRFRTLAFIEIASSVAGLALTVAWLLLGSALAALIGGLMLRAVTRTVLLLVVGARQIAPRFQFAVASLNVVGRFGAFRTADLTLAFFVQRMDRILIALFFGQEALGIYAFAWNIAVESIQRLIPAFTQVLFPGLSRIKGDLARVTEAYCEGLKVISAATLPIVIAIVVCSPIAVPPLFGEQWRPAVPLIQILSVVAAMRVAMSPSGVLLMSQGRPEITLYWNIGLSTLGAAVMAGVAATGHLIHVAIAFAGVYILLFLIHPFPLLRPVLPGIRFDQILNALAAPALLSCLAGIGAAVAAHLAPWGALTDLVIQFFMGSLIYVAGFLMVDRAFLRETSVLLARRREDDRA